MQLRILNENEIDETLAAAMRQTLVICFPDDAEKYSRSRHYEGNVPLYNVRIEDGGVVAANLDVVDRTIKVSGESVRVAGVGSVCVLPQYRGKGLSDSILKVAMEEALRRNFDFGLLFTSRQVKKVYARNGWIDMADQKFLSLRQGRGIELSAEGVRMYYQLGEKEFPQGIVDLCGIDW